MKLNKKSTLLIASFIFVAVEILFTVLVQRVTGDANRYVSYFSIVLACLFCLVFAENTWEYLLTQVALIFTLFSDYFLVLSIEIRQFPAMVFFSVVQLAYFMRIYLSSEKKSLRTTHTVVRTAVTLSAVAITFAVLKQNADAVSVISMFYFANLLVNVIFAFVGFRQNYLLALGLLLFACCDVLIGLSCVEAYIQLTPGSFVHKLAHTSCNLAWIFYIPSQMLISLSLLPKKLNKPE